MGRSLGKFVGGNRAGMNICFINLPIEFYSPISGGAIATIIAQTAEELIRSGHKITVLTPSNGDPPYNIGSVVTVNAKQRNDLSFLRRRWSDVLRRLNRYDWPYYEFYLRSVIQTLKQLRPIPDAVVIFNDLYLSPHIRGAVPGARIAVWLQNECRTHPGNLAKTRKATDIFLTCSKYIADWTAHTHRIAPERFTVIASGVNATTFSPRTNFAAPPILAKVLFLGRLDRNKGPDIVAAAVAALRAEGLNVTLTVAGGVWFYSVGDPNADPFYRSLMASLKQMQATPLGHVPRDQVPELVRSHDIVCVLSRSNEPFGLVALEAMASGCAVLSSNRGGLPEACGDAGVLVDPDDLTAVINALRALITNPDYLTDQKKKSVSRAALAGWDKTALGLEAALTKLNT